MSRDSELIDRIEAIRGLNNPVWMKFVRLAYELAPDRAREISREISRLDKDIDRVHDELARPTFPPNREMQEGDEGPTCKRCGKRPRFCHCLLETPR